MTAIAGRQVKKGDELYHMARKKWGVIVDFDAGTPVLRITDSNNAQNYADFRVTEGGYIKGVRQVYWHEPLKLDLPYRNLAKIEKLVAFYLNELGD